MTYNNAYFFVLLRGIDILACTFVWRDYDVTISSMCGLELRKATPARWARWLGGALNWLQRGHCEMAVASDKLRCLEALKVLT